MSYKLQLAKKKEKVELKETMVVINGKTYLFWKDFYRGGAIRFHEVPNNTIIPIRNANAPTFEGTMEEAISYVKKESKN